MLQRLKSLGLHLRREGAREVANCPQVLVKSGNKG